MQMQYQHRPTWRQLLPQGVRWLLGLNLGMFILQSLMPYHVVLRGLALLPAS